VDPTSCLVMPTLAERIIGTLAEAGKPMSDSQLAKHLDVVHQAVNQTCNALAKQGKIKRAKSVGGSIQNILVNPSVAQTPKAPSTASVTPGKLLAEDEVKKAVQDHLTAHGYQVQVAWGHHPGIDIEAQRPDDRILIEAKGEVESNPQQHNYFVGALGELVQRLADPDARYGLALPDNQQYRNLVKKLPGVARERLHLVVYFVARTETGMAVTEA
jgi:hypothetical protein